MRTSRSFVVVTVLGVAGLTGLAWAGDFQPIVAAGGVNWSRLDFRRLGMSADGLTVVGGGASPAPGDIEAFRWSPASGLQWLGFYNRVGDDTPESTAYATSDDGSIIVGSSYVSHYNVINLRVTEVSGFRWENGVYTGLPWASGDDEAYPLDVTGDGVVPVGASYELDVGPFWIDSWFSAVKWVSNAPRGIGGLGGDDDHYAIGVSHDGFVIVGQSGEVSDYWRPYALWNNGARLPLGLLHQGSCPGPVYGPHSCNEVEDVSYSGAWAVGHLYNGAEIVPVRWELSTQQPTALPLLPSNIAGKAYCVSMNGAVIGGSSDGRAVLWRNGPAAPPILVDTLLQTLRLGTKIAGWDLTAVTRVSSDGKRIAGRGKHPNGRQWYWYADLTNAPINDACTSAQVISQGVLPPPYVEPSMRTSRGTTLEATVDGAPACTSPDGPDVWYKYTAPVDGHLYLDLCGTTLEDPAISVHANCPGGSANQIFCSTSCPSATCGGPCIEPPWVPMSAGQTYYIRVASKPGGTGGSFDLHTRFFPNNDTCDDAFLVDVPSTTPGRTSGATVDNAPTCQGVTNTAPGVWYRVIGSGTTMTAATCDFADFDTKISVYCSGCGGQTCIAANDDGCGQLVTNDRAKVSWCSAPGAVYHILVHGAGSETGSFDLDVSKDGTACGLTLSCHPVNEECGRAIPLEEGTIMVDNTGANSSASTSTCSASSHDIWFTYPTACDGEITIDTCQGGIGSLDDTVVSVFDACDGFELACNDDFSDATVDCGFRSAVVMPTAPGQQLLIRAAGFGGVTAEGSFPLRVTEVPGTMTLYGGGALPDTAQDQPYFQNLPIGGGCPFFIVNGIPYYSVSAFPLPPGLTIDGSGLLSGTPTVSGRYEFQVDVGDRDISTPGDSATFTLTVLPSNDDCGNATPVAEGGYAFGNVGTTTDGPDEPSACDVSGDTNVKSDIWYRYTSACDGIATASLCGSAYDTKLAVYSGGICPTTESALACDDDFCTLRSRLDFRVARDGKYLIRIGGFDGAQGNGELLLTCIDDCNRNNIDDAIELADATATDCNSNRVLDECEINSATSLDCNANGLPDECDIRTDAAPGFHMIGFGSSYNANISDVDAAFPVGLVTLGGVPFNIPATGRNFWHSVSAAGPNPRSIDITPSRPGVVEVHTLINTYWGQPGPASYAWLEFFGSDGAYFRKNLIGNVDIRDFNQLFFTNNINGTTTTNVFTVGSHRLDKQRIDLPADFHDETLVKIRLSDNGSDGSTRVFLAGVTVRIGGSTDCNANNVPDECDVAAGAADCNTNGLPDTCDRPGDANGDGLISLADVSFLNACSTGPCAGTSCTPALYTNSCCATVDMDSDGDVDLPDFAEFQKRFNTTSELGCAEPGAGLVGWWPGNATTDDIIGGNDAVLVNGATFVPGIVGSAFQFGPGGSYAATIANIALTGNSPRTLCAWVKSASDYSSSCCATPFSFGAPFAGGGFGAFISGGKWWFWGYQNDILTDVDTDTDWHHHCVTYDGAEVVYYLDGAVIASQAKSLNTASSPLVLGDGFDHRQETRFEGLVDEVMIWDRALTPEGVLALVQAGTEGACNP